MLESSSCSVLVVISCWFDMREVARVTKGRGGLADKEDTENEEEGAGVRVVLKLLLQFFS
jgi:hypothetical protein